MKVITLHPSRFAQACGELAEMVAGWSPDLIVGIATGGETVGREIARHIPSAAFHTVRLQRGSTPRKTRIRKLLKWLPTGVADRLRMAEARRATTPPHIIHDVPMDARIETILRSSPESRVLIVDDAVDSGDTLRSVVEAVRGIAPHAQIKTAVLTVTTPQPAITPDYALWKDKTLLRFPWSLDYRSSRP